MAYDRHAGEGDSEGDTEGGDGRAVKQLRGGGGPRSRGLQGARLLSMQEAYELMVRRRFRQGCFL
jgi:hypothetical protein